MTPRSDAPPSSPRARGQFSELLRVQLRLAAREPYGLIGIALPTGLLVVFWYIGTKSGGDVAGSGLTILELWIPTLLVIAYIALALEGMPVTLVRDREMGWLRRVSTTPVSPMRLLAAQLLLNVVLAAIATGIMIGVGIGLFRVPLEIGLLFVGVAALAIVEIFSVGLLIAAVAPSQQGAQALAGGLFFLLMFMSGLWVQPVQVGGAFANVMYYSPSGAAVRALLYSTFNATPPYTALVTMAVYTVIFVLVAVRYFRWE